MQHLRDLLDSDGEFEEVRGTRSQRFIYDTEKKLSLEVMRLSTEKTRNGRITVVCLTLICHSDASWQRKTFYQQSFTIWS